MNALEKSFSDYLARTWSPDVIKPFLFVYIELLLTFEPQLPREAAAAVKERQKQLLGQPFEVRTIESLRAATRSDLARYARKGDRASVEANINKMLFCALLDTEESDYFYLTEPIFEFALNMGVSQARLQKILENQFENFSAY